MKKIRMSALKKDSTHTHPIYRRPIAGHGGLQYVQLKKKNLTAPNECYLYLNNTHTLSLYAHTHFDRRHPPTHHGRSQ